MCRVPALQISGSGTAAAGPWTAKSACSKEEGSTGAELRSKGEGSTGAELNLWSSKVLREKGHKASEAHETRSYVPAQMRSQAEARDAPSCPYLGTWLPSAYE
eukprot:1158317-Pelagomonas_calceolata.AAC.6